MPVTQATVQHMQESYVEAFGAIANAFGNKVIISGVADQGNSWGNGWVIINGELMPFVGGVKSPNVIIDVITGTRQYQDGVTRPMYYTKQAKTGVTGGFPFNDFFRLTTIKDLTMSVFKTGMIIMWSGAVSQIPAGFALCDGQAGRPNLSGRFIVGYDPNDTDYDQIGEQGGAKAKTIAINNMPEHVHEGLEAENTSHGSASSIQNGPNVKLLVNVTGGPVASISKAKTGKTGGNTPLDIRPPYYVLAYIIKL